MAPALAAPPRPAIDLDILAFARPADTLRIRLAEPNDEGSPVDDQSYILSQLQTGAFTAQDATTLCRTNNVELRLTDTCDWNTLRRFASQMQGRIAEIILVPPDGQSLVDPSVLDREFAWLQCRFKPNGIPAIGPLRLLRRKHALGLPPDFDADLVDTLRAGTWTKVGRGGHLIVLRIADSIDEGDDDDDNVGFRKFFRHYVLPHFEILRAI